MSLVEYPILINGVYEEQSGTLTGYATEVANFMEVPQILFAVKMNPGHAVYDMGNGQFEIEHDENTVFHFGTGPAPISGEIDLTEYDELRYNDARKYLDNLGVLRADTNTLRSHACHNFSVSYLPATGRVQISGDIPLDTVLAIADFVRMAPVPTIASGDVKPWKASDMNLNNCTDAAPDHLSDE